MLVKGWMNTHVITIGEDTAMVKAPIIMKEKRIRTLPVVDKNGGLVGIVTDRDLKDASPSKATSLNVYELNFLLSRLKVRDIMSRDLVFVRPDETIEFAAILMLDNKISSLPVINQQHHLVGSIGIAPLVNLVHDAICLVREIAEGQGESRLLIIHLSHVHQVHALVDLAVFIGLVRLGNSQGNELTHALVTTHPLPRIGRIDHHQIDR